jgi:membrane protease YdiL (CAAX protease family)
LALSVAVLGVVNLLNNRYARRAYVATSLITVVVLLALLWLAGGTWADAGLARDTLGPGLAWGAVLVAAVAVGCALAAALPWTRQMFVDNRVVGVRPREVAYETLVRIPIGTVALEEVAFRGVLYGLAVLAYDRVVWATVLSAGLFGLWHVFPARELLALNPAAGRVFRTRNMLIVPAAVLATALVGVVFAEIRRRTGSLVPVLALHWATNALGYLTAFVVTRWLRAGD